MREDRFSYFLTIYRTVLNEKVSCVLYLFLLNSEYNEVEKNDNISIDV